MAFMDNMRDRLTQVSQTASQKTKDFSELAKLNSQISRTEEQISELYGKIGYEVYRAYCDAPLPEVAELIQQVTDMHKTIEDSKKRISSLKTTDTCPNCGAKINKGMAFCSGCGHRLVAEVSAPDKGTMFCSGCGAQIPADSTFCTACGQKIV